MDIFGEFLYLYSFSRVICKGDLRLGFLVIGWLSLFKFCPGGVFLGFFPRQGAA